MPELAEVETIKRYLEKHIIDQKIVSFDKYRDSLRYPLATNLADQIMGGTIKRARRRAKYLLLDLCNDNSIIVHLGMSGRFSVKEMEYAKQKHDHIVMRLHAGQQLILNDARRFGMFYCIPTNELPQQSFFKNLGAEPLDSDFNVEYLKNKIAGKNQSIKSCIMDNAIVVGVGNIYAAESLFAARIHPRRPAFSLSDNEISRLVDNIKQVLLNAIDAGGTTLRDFVGGDNEPGYFKQELNVYGRESQPCKVCRSSIETIKQSGRTSFFCEQCQI